MKRREDFMELTLDCLQCSNGKGPGGGGGGLPYGMDGDARRKF